MNVLSKILLTPIASLYGFITALRNGLFDINILKSTSFDIPVICVGNATVGGTGKTPHTEYIISLLHKKYRVATLSRGYKRKTRGFVLASETSKVSDIGDESMQIYRKFPGVIVACCEKRVEGIKRLLALPEPPQVIVLDDAYQHRYVKAGMNILLCDYNRPIYQDKMLPLGRLRENFKNAVHRATHVVVTKCPSVLTPIEKRVIMNSLDMYPFQQLYYSKIGYGQPATLAGTMSEQDFSEWLGERSAERASVLVVTGIASPRPFLKEIKNHFPERCRILAFKDHNRYSDADLNKISKEFNALPQGPKYIITTEKDAVKLSELSLPGWVENLYYVPIQVTFFDGKATLSEAVLSYVAKNQTKR